MLVDVTVLLATSAQPVNPSPVPSATCKVAEVADLVEDVCKFASQYAVIVPSQFAEVYFQYLGFVIATFVVEVVEEKLPISICVSVLVSVAESWMMMIRAALI